MGLFKPAWMSTNEEKALKAVERMVIIPNKLTDQEVLSYVVMNDEDSFLRGKIIKKLTNQDTLGSIAKNDADNKLREIAIERLTDKHLLSEIAFSTDKDKYTFEYDKALRTGTGDDDFVHDIVTDIYDLRKIAQKRLAQLKGSR